MWALTLCVVALFGGCVTSSGPEGAVESPVRFQPKPQDARLARLYFLRERGYPGMATSIKVDGQTVGSVSKGFYFSVDRPPGRYRLASVNPLAMDYESEIQIEAGRSYYIGLGVLQAGPTFQNVVNQTFAGSSGEQMRPTSALMAGFSAVALYQIDATQGPAILSQLKSQ